VSFAITVSSGAPDDQLAPGTYPARLKTVSEKEIEYQGETREVYEWAFLVDTYEDDGSLGEPIEITGLSSRMTGPKSKTSAFLVALLGPAAVQPGATFTMNDLIGKECLIQTELNASGYHKVVGATPVPVQAARRQTNRAAAGVAQPVPVAAPVAVPAPAAAEEEDLPF
jgi:hypothetical protein